MDEQRSDRDALAELDDRQEGVTEQRPSQAAPLVTLVDSHPCEHHDRDGISPQALADPGGDVLVVLHAARGQGVVTDHGAGVIADDPRFR